MQIIECLLLTTFIGLICVPTPTDLPQPEWCVHNAWHGGPGRPVRFGTCYGAATGSLSLEIKSSPDAITDEGTTLHTWPSFSSFPGFTELDLMVTNCQIHLPFCKINPWRVGRLSLDFVLLQLSAGHGHMFIPPTPHQHPSISGTLPAFYHCSFVFCCASAAVLWLPDVTHN